jgi:hypothetical protein
METVKADCDVVRCDGQTDRTALYGAFSRLEITSDFHQY